MKETFCVLQMKSVKRGDAKFQKVEWGTKRVRKQNFLKKLEGKPTQKDTLFSDHPSKSRYSSKISRESFKFLKILRHILEIGRVMPQAVGYMLLGFSQHIDCQNNTKYIFTKFHKMGNSSQKYRSTPQNGYQQWIICCKKISLVR